jgi:hypothetical protein
LFRNSHLNRISPFSSPQPTACLQYVHNIVGPKNHINVKVQPSTFYFDGSRIQMKKIHNNFQLILVTEADSRPIVLNDIEALEEIERQKDNLPEFTKFEKKFAPAAIKLAFADQDGTQLLTLNTDATSKFASFDRNNSSVTPADKYFARNLVFRTVSLLDADPHCRHVDILSNFPQDACRCVEISKINVDKSTLLQLPYIVDEVRTGMMTLRLFRDNIALLVYLICMTEEATSPMNPLMMDLNNKFGIPMHLGTLSEKGRTYVMKHLQTRICMSPRFNQIKNLYMKYCDAFNLEKPGLSTHAFDLILQAAFSQTSLIFNYLIAYNKKRLPESNVPNLWNAIMTSDPTAVVKNLAVKGQQQPISLQEVMLTVLSDVPTDVPSDRTVADGARVSSGLTKRVAPTPIANSDYFTPPPPKQVHRIVVQGEAEEQPEPADEPPISKEHMELLYNETLQQE